MYKYQRIYIDNNIIAFIKNIIFKKPNNSGLDVLMEEASLVYLSNLKSIKIEFLLSQESLFEINRLSANSEKRVELEAVYRAFKKAPVFRNAAVRYDDPLVTYDSPDITYDHPYDDSVLNKVRSFLSSKGNTDDFDARYIANASLPENKIDAFMTFDKKSLWNYRKDIKTEFGVEVKLPSEIAEYYKYVL